MKIPNAPLVKNIQFLFYGSMSIVHIKHMLHFPKNICSAVHLPEPSINQSILRQAQVARISRDTLVGAASQLSNCTDMH